MTAGLMIGEKSREAFEALVGQWAQETRHKRKDGDLRPKDDPRNRYHLMDEFPK